MEKTLLDNDAPLQITAADTAEYIADLARGLAKLADDARMRELAAALRRVADQAHDAHRDPGASPLSRHF